MTDVNGLRTKNWNILIANRLRIEKLKIYSIYRLKTLFKDYVNIYIKYKKQYIYHYSINNMKYKSHKNK